MDNFDLFIGRILDHEGGFTLNRNDKGNWTGGKVGVGVLKGTKFGIAANTYGNLDIKNLTWADAKAIYRRDFWNRFRLNELHPAIAFSVLDGCINHGPGNAIRWLQRAAGVADDGIIGPRTVAAVNAMDVNDAVLKFNSIRIRFFTDLNDFAIFGRGWMRRVADNLAHAAKDN